jgi:hypothetical protein
MALCGGSSADLAVLLAHWQQDSTGSSSMLCSSRWLHCCCVHGTAAVENSLLRGYTLISKQHLLGLHKNHLIVHLVAIVLLNGVMWARADIKLG